MKFYRNIIQVVTAVIITTSYSLAFAETSRGLKTVVRDNCAFGFDLYKKLKESKGNLFFSPYSISTVLAMTYAGAGGVTEKEMAEVLHFSLKQKPLHASFSRLQSGINTIQDKGQIKLSIANSLWAQKGYRFLDSFFKLNKKFYGAGVKHVDFKRAPDPARKAINTWVENKTQHKIKELLKPRMIDSLTSLVLCNAVYFKGNWLMQFDKNKTMDDDFYLSANKTIKVAMMSNKSKYKYKDYRDFNAIELPYDGNDLSMVIFLPKNVDGMAEFERNLTNDNVKTWVDELMLSEKSEIMVSIPKFKTTSEFELSKTLSDMGMPSAFMLPPADFSGMTGKKELYISKVIHKAFVNINEEGTEAAAATAVVMRKGGAPLIFRADHPFIFIVRENNTGSILFIGRIIDPTR